MGWYVTCSICNREDKYNLTCDCYNREKLEIIEKIKGFTIEESIIVDDYMYTFWYQKLKKNEDILFLMTVIRNSEGEYKIERTMQLIKEDEYLSKSKDGLSILEYKKTYDCTYQSEDEGYQSSN